MKTLLQFLESHQPNRSRFATAFLLFMTFLLSGSSSFGQVTTLNSWSNLLNGTGNYSASYTIANGSNSNRMLVVAVASSTQSAGARTVTITYGGQTPTSSVGDMSSSTIQHTQLYYFNEAKLDAASNNTLSVSFSGGTATLNTVFAAVFDNVNQLDPITNSQNYNSGSTQVDPVVFGTALSINTGDQAFAIISTVRTGNTGSRSIDGYPTDWTNAGGEQTGSYDPTGSGNDQGIRNAVANRSIPTSNTTNTVSINLNNSARASMTAISLKTVPPPPIFRSRATGNWSATGTWSISTDNGASYVNATRIPTSSDNVIINSGHTVTVDVDNAACAAVDFLSTSSASSTLSLGSGSNLTVSGTITIPRQGTNINTFNVAVGSATVGAIAFTDGGGGVRHRVTISTGTLTVLGDITTDDPDVSASVIFSGAGVLNVGGQLMSSGTVGGTLTTFAGSTVNYNGNVGQTARVHTYLGNLTLSGSGVKTFATTPTVNGVLSLEGTATISIVPTYGASASLRYNTSTARTAGVEWITPFVATGGVVIANTGAVTLNGAKVLGANTNVPLTINSGAVLTPGSNLLTFHGDFINSGTLTSGSGGITIAGTVAVQSIAGFTTTGTVSMTKTSGIATFAGNVNGAGLTINGLGGTLNLGTSLTHNFTGTCTRTNGTLNGGSSTVKFSNATAFTGTGGIFTAGGGTVEFSGANQTVPVLGYNNLTFSGTGVKTFASGSSLNMPGTFVINDGTTALIPDATRYDVGVFRTGSTNRPAGVYSGTSGSAPSTFVVNSRSRNVTDIEALGSTTTGVLVMNAAALPVTLSSFTAKPTPDNKVSLAWVTSTEQVNKGFRIERQAGNENGKFEQIGFVGSKAKDGNSQNMLTYNFIDAAPKVGAASFYRLVQEDLDGKLTYTEVRVVKLNGQSVSMVFPNPSNGAVNISRTADGKKMNIQVIDQSGKIINQVNNITDANYRMNLPQSGIYSIKMMYPETGEQSIQRIVVQK